MKKLLLFLSIISIGGVRAYSQTTYTEDFENEGNVTWINQGADSYQEVTNSSSCTGKSYRHNAYNTYPVRILQSPSFETNGTEVIVSFDYKVEDYGGSQATSISNFTLKLQYSMDGEIWHDQYVVNAENHVEAMTCATVQTTIAAGVIPSGVFSLRFETTRYDGDFYAYFDNISVTLTEPSCSVPNNVAYSNAGENTANISWQPSTSTVNNGYQVYYSIENTLPDDTTVFNDTNSVSVDASTTSVLLTGLTPSTTYYARVRANCSDTDTSGWSSSVTFRTKCASVDTPYMMNFDNLSPGNVGECETVINEGQGNRWKVEDAEYEGYEGYTGKVLTYRYSSSQPANTWFFTQGLNLEADKSYIVKFKYGTGDYSEKFKVAYGTGTEGVDMVHEIVNLVNIIEETPQVVEYTITPTETGVYYIGFQAYSDADQYHLYLDDISVMEDLSVGTSNQELTSLNVYPNPAKDIINISNDVAINNVEIFDTNGRRLLNQAVGQTSTTIDVSSFATGTYFVKVTAEGKTSTKQIVVK